MLRLTICQPQSDSAERTAIGQELCVDFLGVDSRLLQNAQQLMSFLTTALEACHFHIVDQVCFQFPGSQSGFTGVVLLSESHSAIHTYPEFNYLALDIFSCGAPDPSLVVSRFAEELRPISIRTCVVTRGANLRKLDRILTGSTSNQNETVITDVQQSSAKTI